MKKVRNILCIFVITLLLCTISVDAKQLTIDDLGKSLGDDVDSAYIIGDYVFTSKNGGLKLEDIMLAARSISVDDVDENDINALREKMYIARIVRQYDDATDKPTGKWEIKKNLIGDYELPNEVEVDHVDGKIVKENSDFSINLNTANYQENLTKLGFSGNENYSENLKINGKKLNGLILKKDLTVDSFSNEDKTGYYFAFTLKIPKAKSNTIVTLKGKRTYRFTKANFDGQDEVVVLWALDKNLADKTITITVDVDGDGQQYLENSFVLDYSELEFQEDSELKISVPDNTSYQLSDLNLTGSVYQTVEDKKYYVDLKLSASKAVNGKATLLVDGTSETLNSGDFSNFTLKHELTETCQGENCKLEVTIDYDGNEHKYLPKTYTIKYTNINYVKNYEVTFKYPDKDQTQNVYANAKIQKPEDPTPNEYHKFLGWALRDNQRTNVEIENYVVNSDVTFVPHWELINIDDFISSKIDENNKLEKIHEKINFIEKNGSIEADVLAPEIPTSAINETIIPDTIYELLSKDEITGIDIQIGGSETTITSNNVTLESVKSEISDLLADDSLANATLDDIVSKEKNLTISVASVADNIEELSDSYTIDFVSDFRIVDDLNSLKKSLDNIDVDMIYINNDITVENTDGSNVSFTIDTERNVTLKSLNNKDIKTISLVDKKLEDTFDPDKEPVIIVNKGNITIEDLKIKGGSTAIRIGNGTNVANVTLSNVTAVDSINSAFDVNANSSLTVPKGSSVYYKKTVDGALKDKESYYTPTICGKGKVNIDGITSVSNYERIVRSEDNTWSEDDFKDPETHEFYPDFVDANGQLKQAYKDLKGKNTSNHTEYISKTDHTHYYLDKENSKYYKFHFWDSRVRLIIYKYFAKGDEIIPPVDNTYTTAEKEGGLHFFKKAFTNKEDGKTYVHEGWTDLSTGINGKEVELKLPDSNEEPVSYYSRFVEGYSILIRYNESGKEKVGVFGIVKPTNGEQVKISDLMTKTSKYYDPDFKEAWEKIKAEAESAQNTGKNIYDTVGTISEIVNENSIINGNIDLKVTEQTKANIALASNSQDYNLSDNSLSGKLYANKFAINVNIPNVEANKSTITVTNPNNEVNTIKATSKNTQIELAAITSSMLNNNANKVYKIAVDADGEESNFGPKVISIDYGKLTLAEETINYAATNTLNAESLTYKNRGHFKDEDRLIDVVYQKGNYNTQYYKEYSKSGDNLNPKYEVYYYNPDGHTFVEYAKYKKLSRHEKTLAYTVALSKDCEKESDSITHKIEDGYYLNGFRYVNNDYHGMGLTELKLLVDVTDDSRIEALNSVERVKKEDGYDLYKVSVSSDRINEWLDNNYDAYNNSGTSVADGDYLIENAITLMVQVSDSGYITKIYTQSGDEFSYRRATKTDKETDYYRYNDNKFDITISKINETVVPDIYTVLNIQEQTDEEGNVVKSKENIVKEFLKSAGYNHNLEQ